MKLRIFFRALETNFQNSQQININELEANRIKARKALILGGSQPANLWNQNNNNYINQIELFGHGVNVNEGSNIEICCICQQPL